MADRPDIVAKPPTWATDPTADTVDPGIAKQAAGWEDFEPVNNGHLNEMMRRFGEWISYLDGAGVGVDHAGYVKGTGDEGLAASWSASDLTVTLNAFTGIAGGREYTPTDLIATITTDANNRWWVVYLDSDGALQASMGNYVDGNPRLVSPLPTGLLLFAVHVTGGITTFGTPPTRIIDLRGRDPHAPRWRYLEDAYDQMADREIALIHDPAAEDYTLTGGEPGGAGVGIVSIASSIGYDGGGPSDNTVKNVVACTGRSVIVGGGPGDDPLELSRNLQTVLTTYTLAQTNTSGVRKIVTDGATVVAIHDNWVEVFDIDGTHAWDYNHTATLRDVWLSKGHVYICGTPDGSTKSVRKLDRVAGTVDWSYDHGNDVYAIWSDDDTVHIDGLASGHASGATFRIIASNGRDAANEGGIGADASGKSQDVVSATLQASHFRYIEAPDGALYRVASTGAVGYIEEHYKEPAIPGSGGIGAGRSVTFLVSDYTCCDVDHQSIYIQSDDGWLSCIDRETMSIVWKKDLNSGSIDHIFGLATDGQRLYLDAGLIAGTTTIQAKARGNRHPVRFQKFADPGDTSRKHFPRKSMVPLK